MTYPIELTGLDGANPLAFLAAVGTLRLVDQLFPGACSLKWISSGKWVPVLGIPCILDVGRLVAELDARLHRTADPTAATQAQQRQKQYAMLNKKAKEAEKQIRARRLRGAEREAALRAEVQPLRREAEAARREWLRALAAAVPAPFLALGKTVSVPRDEFRQFALAVYERLEGAPARRPDPATPAFNPSGREDADFAAAFGCDGCFRDNGMIAPTEFQLITGSGHQFFLETLSALMEEITPEKLHRSLFGPWTYTDPRRSFRWDPSEDRRYAYGWSDPSDAEVQTEHGANLLAAMALPLFPAVPTEFGHLATTGFNTRHGLPEFTWPIWEPALGVDLLRSLLALELLRQESPDRSYLRRLGIVEVFRTRKIEVGRPPLSKLNLTPPVSA